MSVKCPKCLISVLDSTAEIVYALSKEHTPGLNQVYPIKKTINPVTCASGKLEFDNVVSKPQNTDTLRSTFYSLHLHTQFRNKIIVLLFNFFDICSNCSNCKEFIIGSVNDLAPKRQQNSPYTNLASPRQDIFNATQRYTTDC